MSLLREIVDRIFSPNSDPHAIPVLDGGFSPNSRLEMADQISDIEMPDALVVAFDGDIFVTSGNRILRCRTINLSHPEPFASFDQAVGALAFGNGHLYAALAGTGIVALDPSGRETGRLTEVGKSPVSCVTALAIGRDGSVLLTDGSRANDTRDWLKDLMEKRPGTGRVIRCHGDLSEPRVLADGLSWPAGIAEDGDDLLVSEAWKHCLRRLPRDGGAGKIIVKNFAGYPSRIRAAASGGHWIAFFAVRTQLTEFVLREDAFRTLMMERIERNLWIGPSLGDHFDYREPTQVGRIKKLGIQKPWAPPRSYGLVARINADGEAIESLHSRVSGDTHGITDLAEDGGQLLLISKGHGKLVSVPIDAVSSPSPRGVQ